MSILASLVKAYERLPDAPPFGYSMEKIGFLISLNEDGTVFDVIDLREGDGKRKQPRTMLVPQPVKRTAGIAPNFLWDKTSYVLGVTAGEGRRTADEHADFVKRHLEALQGTDDEGLSALLLFLESWTPSRFAELGWPEEMKDQNIVFALERERRDDVYLHLRPAAQEIWRSESSADTANPQVCLVTGELGPVARLHPSVKGVRGAQSSGAALVSFNLDAFTSYGHEQGDNAPISEAAAFAYTATLNEFLKRDSGHRIQIGDASVVFWADASDAAKAVEAESLFTAYVDARALEAEASKDISIRLEQIRKGVHLKQIEPELAEGVRFHVLALAPNAARLSVRFYFEGSFGTLTDNYQAYLKDMEFEPWPRGRDRPTIGACVLRTAPARRDPADRIRFDREQQSPLLSGELLRAILSGARFPRSLLPHLLARIRSDHVLDSTRIALIKALIVRDMRVSNELPESTDGKPKEEYLVRTQPDDPNPARRLGRLFAVIERAQLAALGDQINATVKDKFLSAAAATPQQVFVGILKNSQNHTRRLRNGHSDASWINDSQHARRVGAALERDIGKLWGSFEKGIPTQHSNEEQGLFLVGYYQERFGGRPDADSGDAPETDNDATRGEE